MYGQRQPHPDLPVILEEANEGISTPSSATTPVQEIEDEGDDDGDTSKFDEVSLGAESYANSYAFTLDNVGFDEENSLVGSVVGSVIGAATGTSSAGVIGGGSSLFQHTPPSTYTPERINRHERKLHRETCRTLGLPYSEESLSSSSPSSKGSGTDSSSSQSVGKDSSILGSISVSSGSADELELQRRRKMDQMWPWPTKSNKEKKDAMSFDVPLEKMKSTSSGNSADEKGVDVQQSSGQSRRLVNMAKISETTSAYTTKWKDAMANFNERIEDAYQKANPQHQNTATAREQVVAPAGSNNNNEDEDALVANKKKPSSRAAVFSELLFKRPGWVDTYKQANVVTKLTVGTTILFMLLCIIVILATVTVSNHASRTDLNNNDWTSDVDTVVLGEPQESGSNAVVAVESTAAVITASPLAAPVKNTISPTSVAPSHAPSASPFQAFLVLPDSNSDNQRDSSNTNTVTSNEPCVDKRGKQKSSQGKNRKCHWLTDSADTLYSDRQDEECGAVGQLEISEMGLNCRFSCRAYNGCLLQQASQASEEEAEAETKSEAEEFVSGEVSEEGSVMRVKEDFELGGEDSSIAMMVQSAPETNVPTDPSTVRITNAPRTRPTTSNPTTSDPTHSPAITSIIVSSKAETNETQTTTFKEEEEVSPTFVDIRGLTRECWWLDIRNQYQKKIRRDANCVKEAVQITCPSACDEYVASIAIIEVGMQTDKETPFPTTPSSLTALTNSPMMSPLSSSLIVAIESIEEEEETFAMDSATFINTRGREVQCGWLDIRNQNQLEIRRDANCIKEAVQATCPDACAEYIDDTMVVMKSSQSFGGSQAEDSDEAVDTGSNNQASENRAEDIVPVLTPTQMLRMKDYNLPPEQEEIEQHHHDPLPQDMCFDGHGYYLNHRGEPKQCAWLTGSDDPTDETRRIKNCGYKGGDFPEGTDLGRMCRDTCRTCDGVL